MILGEVIGNVWATKKDEKLNGLKLLVVKPLNFNGTKKDSTMVAADSVGAGIGDRVLIVKGSSARMSNSGEKLPVDATIVGIIDSLEIRED